MSEEAASPFEGQQKIPAGGRYHMNMLQITDSYVDKIFIFSVHFVTPRFILYLGGRRQVNLF